MTLDPAQTAAPGKEIKEGFGKALTVTLVLELAKHPLASVTIKVYVPDAAVVAPASEGFCREEEKLFGPSQLYENVPVPPEAEAVRFKVFPKHIGVLELIVVIVTALPGCVIVTGNVVEEQPLISVTTTEYVPAARLVLSSVLDVPAISNQSKV